MSDAAIPALGRGGTAPVGVPAPTVSGARGAPVAERGPERVRVVEEQDPRGLTHSVLRGLFWAFVGTGGQGVLRLAVLVILARLLTPSEFGVVSAALIVVGLSTIFSQLGVGPAVVQRPDLNADHLRSGFTLSLLFGLATTALLWAIAPATAVFFRMPQLGPVMRWLSLVFVIQSLSVVAESLLQRGLRFRRIAVIDLLAFGLGYGAVGVALALMRLGVWALVGAQLAQAVVRTVVLLLAQAHPKSLLLRRRAAGDLLYFGGGHTAARIGNYAANQADNLVVGRWIGAAALGLYDRAYQLMAAPAMFLGEMLDRVLFPAMVKVQDEKSRLGTAYVRSVSVIALTMLPASAVLFVLAPEVVRVTLGRRWDGVIAPFQVFACGLLLRTSYKMSDSLARATGAVYRRAWRQIAYAVLVAAGAWLGRPWGLMGVALGVLVAIAANFVLMAQLSMKLAGVTGRALWLAHRQALALAVLLGAETWGMAALLRGRHLGPVLVLAGAALPPLLTALALLRFAPRLALGVDGVWMLEKLETHLPWPSRRSRSPAVAVAEPETVAQGDAVAEAHDAARAEEPPLPGPVPAPPDSGPLEVVRLLTRELERAEIRYCQFKSNQHLDQGVRGVTDLDVLVDRTGGSALADVLAQSGYKRFVAPPGGGYPGMEDYLALDDATGRLVHLHVHHRLTTGERHLKGYRLPWEELVLSSRRRDAASGFFVSDPSVEFLLLVARGALKIRGSDRLFAALGRDVVKADLLAEHEWLMARVRPEAVLQLGSSILGEDAGRALGRIMDSGPSLANLLALRRSAWPALRLHRTFTPWSATFHRWGREVQLLGAKLGRRFPGTWGPVSRTDPRGGAVIAFLGADGSGKSSLTHEVAAWLRWKLDARVFYGGSGDGPAILARRPLKVGLRLAHGFGLWKRAGAAGAVARDGADLPGTRSRSERAARVLWALVLAYEKRQTLRRAWRARNRGIVVLYDRYPQAQTMGFNDGPLLDGWRHARSAWRRALARWEGSPYRWAEANPPELVIKLHVSPEVARARKAEIEAREAARREATISRLRYPAGVRVVDLDANRPLDAVLLDSKRAIWKVL